MLITKSPSHRQVYDVFLSLSLSLSLSRVPDPHLHWQASRWSRTGASCFVNFLLKKKSELLELLATANIPQADRLVIRPTDELPRILGTELDAADQIAMPRQSLETLAVCHAPQLDGLVIRSSDELTWIGGVELEAGDAMAVSLHRAVGVGLL